MSGQRNTGTVPKTKHNTRPRRENQVNHIPNNLEWHPEYRPRRVQKESNNYPIFLPEAGNDFSYEPSWGSGLGPSNRTDDDELRWSSVKSSNITPKRGDMEPHQTTSRMNRPENDERLVPESLKAQMARGRFKVKLEQSKKRVEELQQQQAALMSLRHKAIQQVKPVQMEELHPSPVAMRSKAIQQVKPVQKECEKIAKLSERMDDHMMQILKVMENEIEPQTDQQVRNKLNELMAKKAQCDKLLCCLESDVPGCPASPSSEEAENERNDFHENEVTLGAVGGEVEDLHQNIESRHQWDSASTSRREAEKQDNREFDNMAAISAYIENKEMKLEEVMNKFEELQTLMGHMEKLRDLKLTPPSNGHLDNQPEPLQPTQSKNSQTGAVEKHAKKADMTLDSRQLNSYPASTQSADAHGYHNMFDLTSETWAASSWNGAAPAGDSSSDDGEVEYDESPVKLCSSVLRQPSRYPKFRRSTQPNTVNGHAIFKPATSPASSQHQNSLETRVRQRVQPDENHTPPSNSSLAYQINQLQMQMEQMYSLYQNLVEKQTSNYNGPQPWIPPPNPHPSYIPFMGGGSGSQWQQHQILVNSLNQCCQLIWHQQKELSALRQALAMLQDESVYKCGGYGNNLNFESGLLWSQTSPQTLNNQVPPGNRANNYWDNFRSYSRQNLLSGRNKSNEGSIAEASALPVPAPPPPMQPSSTQTENNLQSSRKENSTENGRGRRESPNNNQNSNRRSMRSYNNNPSADSWSVFSLEQSIYSELETVLSERNPNALIQLLSHLKVLRSSQPFEALHPQNGDLGDQNLPNFLHSPEQTGNPTQLLAAQPIPQQPPLPQPPPNVQNLEEKYNQYCLQDDSMSKILAELSKIIDSKESDICTPEFLQQLVNFLTEKINPQIVPKLEASLLKFQGTSLDQLGHVLLCDVAAVIWSHISNQPKQQQQGNMVVLVEQEVEEGAVGGIPLNSQMQNADTELAEADQPQHNSSSNSEGFWGAEIDIPTLEMDNQELPPQENEPIFQNGWLPGQGL